MKTMAKSSTFVATLKFVDSFSKGFSKALSNAAAGQSKLNSIARATSNLGASLSNIGKLMTAGITMPIVTLGTKAVYSAMEYEVSMNKIMTLQRKFASNGVDLSTPKKLAEFKDETKKTITELSNTYGVAQTDLAQSYYLLASAFNDTTHMQQAMTTATQMSIAGNVDAASSARLLATIYNAYGKTMGETDETIRKIGDTMAATVNFGFTEFPELAESMATVVPQAAQMGLSFEDLAASMAVITSTGLSTAEATTYLKNALNQATKQGDRSMFTDDGFLNYLNSLKEDMPEIEQVMEKFKNIRATSGMVALLGNTGLYEGYFKQMKNANGTLEEMYNTVSGSAQHNFSVAITRLNNILERFGERILPTVNRYLEKFADWLGKVELKDEDIDSIIRWGAGLAAAGPALMAIGTGLQVVGAAANSITVLKGLVSACKFFVEHKAVFTAIPAFIGKIGGFIGSAGSAIGTGAASVGGSIGTGATTVGSAILAIPAAPAVLAAGGTAAAGYAAWKTTDAILDEQQANGTYDYDVGTRSKSSGKRVQGVSNAVRVGNNASGTSRWKGGLTTINERGGEIVDLPNGSRIYPHDQSMRMGGLTINIPKFADTITISNKDDIDSFADAFANKLLRVVANR